MKHFFRILLHLIYAFIAFFVVTSLFVAIDRATGEQYGTLFGALSILLLLGLIYLAIRKWPKKTHESTPLPIKPATIPEPSDDFKEQIIQTAWQNIESIQSYTKIIKSETVRKNFDSILNEARKIIVCCQNNHKDFQESRRYLSYHLPEIEKLAIAYTTIETKQVPDKKIKMDTESTVKKYLQFSIQENEKLIDNDLENFDIDLELMNDSMRRERS